MCLYRLTEMYTNGTGICHSAPYFDRCGIEAQTEQGAKQSLCPPQRIAQKYKGVLKTCRLGFGFHYDLEKQFGRWLGFSRVGPSERVLSGSLSQYSTVLLRLRDHSPPFPLAHSKQGCVDHVICSLQSYGVQGSTLTVTCVCLGHVAVPDSLTYMAITRRGSRNSKLFKPRKRKHFLNYIPRRNKCPFP